MKIFKEILIILTICLVGEIIAKILPFDFPSSVIGLLLLLLLLMAKIVRPQQIKETSEFLLHNMAFFFVPAGVYIIGSFNAIKHSVIPLLAVCLLTTIITFVITVYTIMLVMKLTSKKRRKRN